MAYRQSDTYSLHIKDQKTGWSDNYYEYTLADTHDHTATVMSCELPSEITESAAIKAGQYDIVIKQASRYFRRIGYHVNSIGKTLKY